MTCVSPSFETRLRKIDCQKRRPAGEPECYVLEDDLVVVMPRREGNAALAALILVMFPMMSALGAKSLLMARLDAVALGEMLSRLDGSGPFGRAVAWALQPDVLTGLLARGLAGLLG
jgi:hypothetical protein